MPEVGIGNEKKNHFPKNWPVCDSKLIKEEGEAAWRCVNIECPAQVVERIIHFVSKDAMDIRGFGDANVRKFYELGLLKDIPGIYKLNFKKIGELEGFGQKSIDNLQTAIENSKKQPLHRLIFGLGIRFVGETTAKTLAQAVDHLLDFKKFSLEDLQNLEDIGPKVAGSIHHFFSAKDNISMLQQLEKTGLQLKNDKKTFATDGNLTWISFLFTGTLPILKRSDAEEMVEKNGGHLLGGVRGKLKYLVVGEDGGGKFENA